MGCQKKVARWIGYGKDRKIARKYMYLLQIHCLWDLRRGSRIGSQSGSKPDPECNPEPGPEADPEGGTRMEMVP